MMNTQSYQGHPGLLLQTYLGNLLLFANTEGNALRRVDYLGKGLMPQLAQSGAVLPILKEAASQIEEFLAGKRQQFSLSLRPEGTDFQQRIWQELQKIPYGQHISYSELAARVGNPNAVRAAGSACGKNPLPLIVPCHRVLRTGGALGGFAWGLDVKEQLLNLEGQQKRSLLAA